MSEHGDGDGGSSIIEMILKPDDLTTSSFQFPLKTNPTVRNNFNDFKICLNSSRKIDVIMFYL